MLPSELLCVLLYLTSGGVCIHVWISECERPTLCIQPVRHLLPGFIFPTVKTTPLWTLLQCIYVHIFIPHLCFPPNMQVHLLFSTNFTHSPRIDLSYVLPLQSISSIFTSLFILSSTLPLVNLSSVPLFYSQPSSLSSSVCPSPVKLLSLPSHPTSRFIHFLICLFTGTFLAVYLSLFCQICA